MTKGLTGLASHNSNKEIHDQWKDELRSWVPKIDVKESYPVQLAKYTKINVLDDEPTSPINMICRFNLQ